MATSAETVDCFNSGYKQIGPPARESGGGQPASDARGLGEIVAALSGITVQGGRMNEDQMRIVDQTV